MKATVNDQLYRPEGTPDDFQHELENEPVRRIIWNAGVSGASYDKENGMHSNFGNGIFEYRVGDEVSIPSHGGRWIIQAIHPDPKGRVPLFMLDFPGGRRSILSNCKPVNPERIRFGFIVRTSTTLPDGTSTGGASRWITRQAAESEVRRLVAVGYPGAIQVLDSE